MSYLRGNTVVDGNLYVEGVLTYSGQRPDINGAITTYKDEGHGVISGRHLLSKNGEDGALQDSVVIERQTTIENEGTDVSSKDII